MPIDERARPAIDLTRVDLTAVHPAGDGTGVEVGVAVDVVVLTVHDGRLEVLLVERAFEPHRGMWAVPGGFVRADEDLDGAAGRELLDGAGLHLDGAHLEQLRAYGEPDRDPRRRVVSVAYLALVNDPAEPRGGADALDARFWPVSALSTQRGPKLAFDHERIVADAVARLRSLVERTTVATAFVAPQFTLADLRRTYEAIWGRPLHPSNFGRKVRATPGFVVPVPRARAITAGRPAQLYRKGRSATIHPPILRPARAARERSSSPSS